MVKYDKSVINKVWDAIKVIRIKDIVFEER